MAADDPGVPADITQDGGDDRILAGPGNDGVTADNRSLTGLVSGAGGNDTIEGGPGIDQVFGDHAANIVSGDGGDDTIDLGPDRDAAIGDSGAVQELSGHGGNDIIRGGDGDDFFLIGDDTWFEPTTILRAPTVALAAAGERGVDTAALLPRACRWK